MTRTTRGLLGCVALLALASVGCGSSAAPPFDTLPDSNLTAYHLQNYEPPAQAQTPAAGTAVQPGAIPGIPPEILAMAQQGAASLQQFLPPGLIPPGMLPGAAATAAAPAATPAPAEDVPRFPNRPDGFRILRQTQVIDEGLKEKLSELLGDEDNFHDEHASCMYAEIGLSFTSGQPQPNDVLISFSCNQVAAAGGFAWPHPSVGMTPDMVSELSDVLGKAFPPGA